MKKTKQHRVLALLLAIAMLFVGPSVFANNAATAAQEPAVSIQNAFAEIGVPLLAEATGFTEAPVLVWSVDGDQVATGESFTPEAADLEKTIAVSAIVSGETKAQASMYFSKLPVVYINTEGGQEIVSKEDYLNADMKIQGSAEHADGLYDGVIEIRGRGNSSWRDAPKKPYKIKLDKKTDLFGMGKNKHWVLLANSLDDTLMRNTLAVDLAKSMDVMAMDTVFVDVVLNGKYAGNYQLCEQVRVDETRVDIADWEGEAADETNLSGITKANGYDTTGGYLLEINFQYDEISKFTTPKGIAVTFKNPEYANTNQEMMDYVTGYVRDYENAATAADFTNSKGQHYSDLFDFDDLVNYWLVCEYMNNIDAGRYSSTYFYKDTGGDLFHMGPIWDFDYSSGNRRHTEFNGYSAPPNKWQYGKMGLWYSKLVGDPYFVCRLQERYWQMHEAFEKLPLQLDAYRDLIKESALKNEAVWDGSVGSTSVWNGMKSFNTEADFLRQWLLDRTSWIDGQFADLNTAMSSLGEYSSGKTVRLTVKAADDSALSEDTLSQKATAADGMIEWNKDLKVIAKGSTDAAKMNFYLNGKLLSSVAVENGEAILNISSEALVGRGSRNVIQARSLNGAGAFIGTGYTTVMQDKYAPAETFTWPTVDSEAYMEGMALREIDWTAQGKAVYLVDGEPIEIPGTFVWEDGSLKLTAGTNSYNVVFTPAAGYQNDFAAVTGTLSITAETSVRTRLQGVYDEHKDKAQDEYTAASFAPFKQALENAKTVLENESAAETQLQAAYDALTKAVKELIPRAKDTYLTELIEICGMLKEESFTTQSFAALQLQLSNARLFAQQGGNQEEVNAAYKELQRAFNGLERVKK